MNSKSIGIQNKKQATEKKKTKLNLLQYLIIEMIIVNLRLNQMIVDNLNIHQQVMNKENLRLKF